MARNSKTSPFFSLRAVKEDESVVLLPAVFSPSGTKNTYKDERNRLTRIPGQEPVLEHEVAVGQTCRLLFPLTFDPSTRDPLSSRVLVAVVGEGLYDISLEDGGSSTYLGGGINTSEDIVWADSIYDKLYVTSGGTKEVRVLEGDIVRDAGGSQPNAPTIATVAAGEFFGAYRAKYRYILADGSLGLASPASDVAVAGGWKDSGFKLEVTVVNGPTGVQGKLIYLTTGDNDTFFYYAGTIDDNTTTTLEIDSSDILLIQNDELTESGDPPPTGCRVVCATGGALWVGNKDGDRGTAWRSSRGIPESFHVLDQIRFTAQRGDELMALMPEFDRAGETQRTLEMVSFTRKGVYNLFGKSFKFTDPDPYSLVRSKSPTGTLAGHSVVLVPVAGDNVYAYIGSDKKIYIYDGFTSLAASGPIQETLSDIHMAHAHKSFGVYLPPPVDGVFWAFPTGSSEVPNSGLLWQLGENEWTPVSGYSDLAHGVLYQDDDFEFHVVAGEADTTIGSFFYEIFKPGVHQIEGAPGGEATPVNATWRSKPLMSEDGRDKLFEKIEVIAAAASSPVSLVLRFWPSYEDPDTVAPFMEHTIALEGDDESHIAYILDLENDDGEMLVAEGLIVEFSQNEIADPFKLLGFRLTYVRKKRKRR